MMPGFHKLYQAHCRGVALSALAVSLWWGGTSASGAFPIDQFKNFINSKPTIENFEFEVNSEKFAIQGMNTNEFRQFKLAMENGSIYKLTEYQTKYVLRVRDPIDKNSTTNYSPQTDWTWSRYNNSIWNTFNSNGVINTTVADSRTTPSFGPAKGASAMLGVAYDALNLGVFDLQDIGVIWNGLKFTCPSNAIGCTIDGHLELNAAGVPEYIYYTLTKNQRQHHYRAGYSFDANTNLPDFMPSRIIIEFLDAEPIKLTSDYKLLSLVCSRRKLKQEEILLIAQNPGAEVFEYTNGQFFHVHSNVMVNIGSNPHGGFLSRKGVILSLIVILMFLPPPIYLFARFVRRNTKKQ